MKTPTSNALPRRLALASTMVVLLSAGCLVFDGGIDGLPCQTDAECGREFYACVAALDGGKTCEVTFPPPGDGGTDGGVQTVYYCGEVETAIDRYCTGACHGESTAGSGITTFRLDSYGGPDGGSGAYAQAARIKLRMYDLGNMPPPGSEMPSEAERELVARWVSAGAKECATTHPPDSGTPPMDSGTPPPDAGTPPPDSGTPPPDSGTPPPDSGTPPPDAGTAPTWAQVQAILISRCATCHTQTPFEGNFQVNHANSYDYMQHTGRGADCLDAGMRINPGNPSQSFLLSKIAGTPSCGQQMPPSNALKNTHPSEYQLIYDWVAAGAPL